MKQWFEGKTVALVGNAMSLFDKQYGKEIDAHDVVVRLNKAAMLYTRDDCEDSHGKRTDVWMFWNAAEYKSHFHKTKAKKVHVGHQGRNAGNLSTVDFVYPKEYYEYLRDKVGNHRNPTTGIMSLDYISRCNPAKISVYGYDWKETPTFTDPSRKKDRHCPHDHDTEKEYCRTVFFTQQHIILKK
jgi:hypothetical protein